MKLSDISIHAFIQENGIKTESGELLSFKDHPFLFQPYTDESPKQAILKAAQIGFSTLAILKSFWIANKRKMDIIYTLPTQEDVQIFAGGKINRMVSQNPILQEWVKDKDRVEQKSIGESIIYYRGTFNQKQAISHSSDLNIYDEVDSSNQSVIEQYATRLQHSKFKWEWYFSHPSAEGTGVDRYWQRSDQKHWFVRCPSGSCAKEQFLNWPESIDPDRGVFQCKDCGEVLSDNDRRRGRWVVKYRDREYSGYWIPLLICPWVSAKEILDYHKNKPEEYFWNKVLGLPYVGGGNKLTKASLMRNLTQDSLYPDKNDRVIIGMDTGKKLHYVVGGEKGLFAFDTADDYDEIEALMERWPRAICVIDQGGDIIGSRKMRAKYPGRVFLCSYGEDRKTEELVRWGKHDEDGSVIVDRNRMLTMVVEEFTDGRIPIMGFENDWYDYWLHWNNLTRIKEEDENGKVRKIWRRAGDDHWAHATAYWRTGMDRFSNAQGGIIYPDASPSFRTGPEIRPDGKVAYKVRPKYEYAEKEPDWRD